MLPKTALVLVGVTLAAAPGVPDAAGPIPVPRFKPTLDELSNFAEMPADARSAMLRALALRLDARLEEKPDDVEGWLRLARTRAALGERAAALDAFDRALALAPTSPGILRAYAQTLVASGRGEAPVVSADAVALFRRLAVLEPRDPEPHWYLGLAAEQSGDPERAETHWLRALALLRADSPEATRVMRRIEGLRQAAGPLVSGS